MCRVINFILLLILCVHINASAQLFQKMHGYCIDKTTQAPLQGVSLLVYSTSNTLLKSASTDSNGFYMIEQVPVGRINIKASYIGYETFVASQIEVSSAKQLVLNIELVEKYTTLQTLEISAKKEVNALKESLVSVSARTFNIEESNRYAGGFGDLTRMAQSFAGVASSDGQSNEIVIRGNNPRGLLWRIEGIEVSNPNHFPRGDGSAGGGISIIQSNIIDNSGFITGAFPANAGNAASGVFDINLRRGNMQKFEHTIQLGVIGVEAMSEGPMDKKKQSSYLIKYRYSTVALLQKIGIKLVDNTVTPSYQDISFHFYIKTKKAGNFSLFGIGGLSSAGEKATVDSTVWNFTSDKTNALESYYTGIIGLKNTYIFPNKKTTISQTLLYNYEGNKQKSDTFSAGYQKNSLSKSTIQYHTVRYHSSIQYKQNASSNYKLGLIVSVPFYSIQSGTYQNNAFITQHADTGISWIVQAYAQHVYRFKSIWEINSGIHMLYHRLSQYVTLEPRIAIACTFLPKHRVALGIGLHSKTEPISTYMTQVSYDQIHYSTFNRYIKPAQAFHIVLSHDYSILPTLKLKTELYFQYLYAVPISNDSNALFSMINYNGETIRDVLINKGSGMNYGIELSLEKYYSKNYYFLFTSSFFNSKYKINNQVRNTRFNSNYIINATVGKDFEFGKRKKMILGMNTRFVCMGGYRYTPIDTIQSKIENREVLQIDKTFEMRYPVFLRWDIGLYFKMNRKKFNWRVSVDFQNVTNRKNVFNIRYNVEKQTSEYSFGLGFIPVINYKIEF